jgi:integrase/recombinase XerD
MVWEYSIKEFENFLRLEKSLSGNSIEAYIRDIKKLHAFFQLKKLGVNPADVELHQLEDFIGWINALGMTPTSQARIISGIKGFFKYMLMEEKLDNDPSELLEAPRMTRKLPEVLSIMEIDTILSAIDLSKPEGHRNKAMIEVLYSCGLRVSELIHLKISNIFKKQGFIKVEGKGNKERLVPIGKKALDEIARYLPFRNSLEKIDKESVDILFLNRRGKKMTRVMVFTIIKELVKASGIKKNVSPHTFRHSFATHLIEGGADLRAIQEMLGHESIITTEIYTHLDRDFLRGEIIRFHPRS